MSFHQLKFKILYDEPWTSSSICLCIVSCELNDIFLRLSWDQNKIINKGVRKFIEAEFQTNGVGRFLTYTSNMSQIIFLELLISPCEQKIQTACIVGAVWTIPSIINFKEEILLFLSSQKFGFEKQFEINNASLRFKSASMQSSLILLHCWWTRDPNRDDGTLNLLCVSHFDVTLIYLSIYLQ